MPLLGEGRFRARLNEVANGYYGSTIPQEGEAWNKIRDDFWVDLTDKRNFLTVAARYLLEVEPEVEAEAEKSRRLEILRNFLNDNDEKTSQIAHHIGVSLIGAQPEPSKELVRNMVINILAIHKSLSRLQSQSILDPQPLQLVPVKQTNGQAQEQLVEKAKPSKRVPQVPPAPAAATKMAPSLMDRITQRVKKVQQPDKLKHKVEELLSGYGSGLELTESEKTEIRGFSSQAISKLNLFIETLEYLLQHLREGHETKSAERSILTVLENGNPAERKLLDYAYRLVIREELTNPSEYYNSVDELNHVFSNKIFSMDVIKKNREESSRIDAPANNPIEGLASNRHRFTKNERVLEGRRHLHLAEKKRIAGESGETKKSDEKRWARL